MKKIYRIVALLSGLMAFQYSNAQSNCVFEEVDGVVSFEAEDFFSQDKSTVRKWYVIGDGSTTPAPDLDPSHASTASGKKYMEILPDTRVTDKDVLKEGENFSAKPGKMGIITYKVFFNNPGKYYVWVRLYSSGPEDNGMHTGINNTWPTTGERLQWCAGKNNWTWESKQRREPEALHCGVEKEIYVNVPSKGEHLIQFSMREDGVEIDKIVLSKAYTKPTGTGPAVKTKSCAITSVTSTEESLELTAFPNPSADGVFNLSEVLKYEVYDVQGNVVLKGAGDIVNLSTFPQGVYILKSGSRNIKLIK